MLTKIETINEDRVIVRLKPSEAKAILTDLKKLASYQKSERTQKFAEILGNRVASLN
jgi:hypothetical protein